MTQRVKDSGDFQLPPGQLWWIVRYLDGDKVSETLFSFEGEREQTWYHARQRARILVRELIGSTPGQMVTLYDPKH